MLHRSTKRSANVQLAEKNHCAAARREPWQRQLVMRPGKDPVTVRLAQCFGAEILTDGNDVTARGPRIGENRHGACAASIGSTSREKYGSWSHQKM